MSTERSAAADYALARAWDRAEAAIRDTRFAYSVRIYTPLQPLRGYVARVELTYRPEGKKRQRTERIDGEGVTLDEALHQLADALERRKLS